MLSLQFLPRCKRHVFMLWLISTRCSALQITEARVQPFLRKLSSREQKQSCMYVRSIRACPLLSLVLAGGQFKPLGLKLRTRSAWKGFLGGGWTRIQRFLPKSTCESAPGIIYDQILFCTASWGLAKQELQTERFQYPFPLSPQRSPTNYACNFSAQGFAGSRTLVAADAWRLQPQFQSIKSKGAAKSNMKKINKESKGLYLASLKGLLFLCSDPKGMSNTVQDQIFFFTFMTLRLDTKCLDKNDSIQLDGLRPKVLSFIHYSPLWPSPPKVCIPWAKVRPGRGKWTMKNTGQTRKTVSSS